MRLVKLKNLIKIKHFFSLLPGVFCCFLGHLYLNLFNNNIFEKVNYNHKKILIIKLDAIGDFILWLDVAKELRRVYSPNEYKITLLGNRNWTDLAENLNYFDEVLAIDRQAFFTRPAIYFDLLQKLFGTTFEIVLHPVYSREFLFGDLFVWASNAIHKIGMQGDYSNLSWWQKKIGDRCYTNLVSGSCEYDSELEHNALLLRWLGLSDFKACVPDLKASNKPPNTQLPANYYVLIPGASVSLRIWPISCFISLLEKVYALTGMTAVVCGGEKEKELGEIIILRTSAPVINIINQISLTELVTVISEAQFVVGNETGGIHIAAALGVPSICIMGGGHFGRFVPYSNNIVSQKQLPVSVFRRMECFGCNWECIYNIQQGKPAPCIEINTLESVLCAVITLTENIKTVSVNNNY